MPKTIQAIKEINRKTALRHTTGRKNMPAIVAAIKTRPLMLSATIMAHIPIINPIPIPIAW
jgi:hypothetical protein